MQEPGVVAATTEHTNNTLRIALPGLVETLVELAPIGRDDLLERLGADSVQFRSSSEADARAGDSDVDVEVRNGGLSEPVGIVLYPLDGADEAILFSVP